MNTLSKNSDQFILGDRDCLGIDMMAGYWSKHIHDAVYAIILAKCPAPAKVLDVGAGHGAFSKRLISDGYHVVAIEPFAEFKVPEIKCHAADLNESWPKDIGEPFDAVAAIEIVEHLENPFHFARQARLMLRPGGILVVSTPNVVNIVGRWSFFLHGSVPALAHPDHRTAIFPQTMVQVSKQCGFRILKRTYDIDPLSVSSSRKGRIGKAIVGLLSRVIMRDRKYLGGNSNIWLLSAAV